MEIAISGSSGFIGRHLVQLAEQSQYKVTKLERTGEIKGKFDVVIDLAAYGNMAGHVADPFKVYEANTLRVAKELEQLKGTDTKFIYMSTSSVMLPVQTFYSASKKATEAMIQVAVEDWQLKAAIIRPFSVCGRGEQWEHLIPQLIQSADNNKEIPFVPSPVHDFIDVEDVAEALITVSQKGMFTGEIYEVGTGKQVPNQEVLKIVSNVMGREPNIKLVSGMRKYDTKRWVADITRMYSLGWVPKKTLEQSIREEYEYYQLGKMI